MDEVVEVWLHAFSISTVSEDELFVSVPGHFTLG
jgi:hypothetical protein